MQSSLTWHRYEHIVNEVQKLSPRGLVLDIGCGFGQITELLRLKGIKAIGLDIGAPGAEKKEWTRNGETYDYSTKDESRQNKVWKDLPSSFILGDGCTLPFASEVFDTVVCCGTLEHVYSERKLLKECSRILKKDSLFLCYYLPNKTGFESLSSKYFYLPTIHKFYDKAMIESLFNHGGFDIFTITREHLIPEPHFVQKIKKLEDLYKNLALFDDVLSRTQLRFFGDNWKVYARKYQGNAQI